MAAAEHAWVSVWMSLGIDVVVDMLGVARHIVHGGDVATVGALVAGL